MWFREVVGTFADQKILLIRSTSLAKNREELLTLVSSGGEQYRLRFEAGKGKVADELMEKIDDPVAGLQMFRDSQAAVIDDARKKSPILLSAHGRH